MTLRYADQASALLLATSAGIVGAFLLADDLHPCWCDSPPQHRVEDDSTSAVRLQARRVSTPPPSLLLLDVIDLQDHAAGSRAHSTTSPGGRVQLLPDPGLGERVFVSLPHAAFCLRLAWLPALAHAFLHNGKGLQDLPQLLPPALEELWRGTGSREVVSAAVIGDVLSGARLAVWDSQGRLQLLQPSHSASHPAVQRPRASSEGLSAEAVAEDGSVFEEAVRVKMAIKRTLFTTGSGSKKACFQAAGLFLEHAPSTGGSRGRGEAGRVGGRGIARPGMAMPGPAGGYQGAQGRHQATTCGIGISSCTRNRNTQAIFGLQLLRWTGKIVTVP
ncbi:hypothetical protein WJX84_004267 [Apatococcus fuscideae]|uniref:Uncharacterized protein n=1 Tax=Apatococcus fuscideae TaxID=2026836 RepID=A0AAW1TBT1_9CHLO